MKQYNKNYNKMDAQSLLREQQRKSLQRDLNISNDIKQQQILKKIIQESQNINSVYSGFVSDAYLSLVLAENCRPITLFHIERSQKTKCKTIVQISSFKNIALNKKTQEVGMHKISPQIKTLSIISLLVSRKNILLVLGQLTWNNIQTKSRNWAILTAGHLIYSDDIDYKTKASQMFFFPELTQTYNGSHVKVQRYIIHKKYINEINKQFDMAILILQQNDLIKITNPLKFDFKYKLSQNQDKYIILSGYHKQKNQQKKGKIKRRIQWQQKCKAVYQTQNSLYYKHQSSQGQSGAPLILQTHLNTNQNQRCYTVIGIHCFGHDENQINWNRGLIFNQSMQKNSLIQFMKQICFSQQNTDSLKIKQNMRLKLKLIEQLDSIRQSYRSFSLHQNLCIFSKLKYKQTHDKFIEEDFYDQIQSGKKLKYFFHELQQLDETKLLVGVSIWQKIIQDFQNTKMIKQQELPYLQHMQYFLRVNLGQQKLQNQFDACGKVASSFYNIMNITHKKAFVYLNDEQAKRLCIMRNKYNQTMSQPPENFVFACIGKLFGCVAQKLNQQELNSYFIKQTRANYLKKFIQILKTGFVNIDAQKRKKQRYQNQLNYYYHSNQSTKAYFFLDRIFVHSDQNIQLLRLKAKVYYKKRDYQASINFNQKALSMLKNEKKLNISDIIQTLNQIGLSYFDLNEFQKAKYENKKSDKKIMISCLSSLKAKQKFEDCLIQLKKLYKQNWASTWQYSQILTNLTIVYLQMKLCKKQDINKAIQTLINADNIISKTIKKQSIKHAQLLNHIGDQYFKISDYQTALIYYRKALKFIQHLTSPDSIDCILSLIKIAWTYEYYQQQYQAIQYHQRLLNLYSLTEEEDSQKCQAFHFRIGYCCLQSSLKHNKDTINKGIYHLKRYFDISQQRDTITKQILQNRLNAVQLLKILFNLKDNTVQYNQLKLKQSSILKQIIKYHKKQNLSQTSISTENSTVRDSNQLTQ